MKKLVFDSEKCAYELGYKHDGSEEVLVWAQQEFNNWYRNNIEKSPDMLCRIDDGIWAADGHTGFARATHKAKLIRIEPIEENK